MTRDEIENMPAKEMDRRLSSIIEPVPNNITVGDLRKTVKDWRFSYYMKSSPLGLWRAQIGTDAGDDTNLAKWEPFYEVSKEIDILWKVIEKLEDRELPILCNISRISDDGTHAGLKWHCHLRQIDGANTYFYAVADTVTASISCAVLLAVAESL